MSELKEWWVLRPSTRKNDPCPEVLPLPVTKETNKQVSCDRCAASNYNAMVSKSDPYLFVSKAAAVNGAIAFTRQVIQDREKDILKLGKFLVDLQETGR